MRYKVKVKLIEFEFEFVLANVCGIIKQNSFPHEIFFWNEKRAGLNPRIDLTTRVPYCPNKVSLPAMTAKLLCLTLLVMTQCQEEEQEAGPLGK